MELLTWVIGAAAVFAAPLAIVTAVHFVMRMHRRAVGTRPKVMLAMSSVAEGATSGDATQRAKGLTASWSGTASLRPLEVTVDHGKADDVMSVGKYAMGAPRATPGDGHGHHEQWGVSASVGQSAA